MKIIKSIFNDVHLLAPKIFSDNRGFFYESYKDLAFNKIAGKEVVFVQDNHSYSKKSVLRGLHYQTEPYQQDKLVRVISGEIFDVVVDVRKNSKTFAQWHGVFLSSNNNNQLWIPKGFAHGFVVTSSDAVVLYKTTEYYYPQYEQTIKFDDPDLNIQWPIKIETVSVKDSSAVYLKDIT